MFLASLFLARFGFVSCFCIFVFLCLGVMPRRICSLLVEPFQSSRNVSSDLYP